MTAALEHRGVTLWHIEPRIPVARATIDRRENRLKRVRYRAKIGRPRRVAIRHMDVERQRCAREGSFQRRQIVTHRLAEHLDMLALVIEYRPTLARVWSKAAIDDDVELLEPDLDMGGA